MEDGQKSLTTEEKAAIEASITGLMEDIQKRIILALE